MRDSQLELRFKNIESRLEKLEGKYIVGVDFAKDGTKDKSVVEEKKLPKPNKQLLSVPLPKNEEKNKAVENNKYKKTTTVKKTETEESKFDKASEIKLEDLS